MARIVYRSALSMKKFLPLVVSLGLFLIAVAGESPFSVGQAQPESPQLRWYKGNTHTHTLNSDGDSTPDEVVRWYREHDYHFLVLSDHNFLTSVDALNALHGADEQFLVIRGEEVTDRFQDKPIHVNGLDVEQVVPPQGGASVAETLQRNVDAIRAVSGIPHINHPNFRWALTAQEMKAVNRYKLFEIYNGHPSVNNMGGGGRPGLEEIWDTLLSSGKEVYGLAVDDAHSFKGEWSPDASRPGRGWVMVRAARLTTEAILAAMEEGQFYASTGVELEDYQVTRDKMLVDIKETASSKYRVQFIGEGGRLLQEVPEDLAVYEFKGNERYVRARILESNGRMAWLQPAFVAKD